MDIDKLLKIITGKMLDADHADLIRRAFIRQSQAIDQINETNTALKETNSLLKEKLQRLDNEISEMRRYVFDSASQLPPSAPAGPAQHLRELSDITEAVLRASLKFKTPEFTLEILTQALPHDQNQIKAAMAELKESGLILKVASEKNGPAYSLSPEGKSYARVISGDSNDLE